MSEYWWDRSGDDPELAELERHLARFSFRETRGSRGAPERSSEERPTTSPSAGRRRLAVRIALAASLPLGLGLWWLRPMPPAWEVLALHGAPRVQDVQLGGRGLWRPGEALETGARDRAKILVDDIGQIDVESDSRLRLVSARSGQWRVALERGLIRLFINAPPRQFFVDTPGAVVADLGCAYSVQVGEGGEGLLRVSFGWVAFESERREVYVPAGAACALHPRTGPGTPYFEDASEGFRSALNQLDGTADAAGRRAALDTLLGEARRRDVITLLQLLRWLTPAEAARVYERAAVLQPPPPGVTLDNVVGPHPQGYDPWWRQMGLGEMKWRRIGREP